MTIDCYDAFGLNQQIDSMNPERSKKFAGMTEKLNSILGKQLEAFSNSTEWTDISSWLINLESTLRAYPSPFIADKVLLSKRLNQCMNPILPEKIHQSVIRIHGLIFTNMKMSVQGNINDFIRLFAEDLAVYSVSILPQLVHTNSLDQRQMIIRLINNHYLLLGKQLVPMLPGLLKALLSVKGSTIQAKLIQMIDSTLQSLLDQVGRRFVVGCTWSLILKYSDCRAAGIKFLSNVIPKMEQVKGQEEFTEERGFSDLIKEIQLTQQGHEHAENGVSSKQIHFADENSQKQVLKNIPRTYSQQIIPTEEINILTPDIELVSPIHNLEDQTQKKTINVSDFSAESQKFLNKTEMHMNGLQKIAEDSREEQRSRRESSDRKVQKKQDKIIQENRDDPSSLKKLEGLDGSGVQQKHGSLFQSQVPFSSKRMILRDQDEIRLDKVPLMVSAGIAEIKEGVDECNDDNNFPRVGSLVVSALIGCLGEEEPIVKRTALDFMFSHLRIRSPLLGDHQRGVLVEALLRLFRKKEISITKRVNRWIFGKQDQENRFMITEKNQFVLAYVTKALQNILETVPTSDHDCAFPLKILQNFYIQHSHLVEATLHQLAPSVLRYVFNFGTRLQGLHNHDYTDQVFKIGKRFLQNLPSYYVVIFDSLGLAFVKGITQKNEEAALEAIKYIDFCYIQLMRHEHGLDELEYITVILGYVCRGLAEVVKQADQSRGSVYRLYLRDTVLLLYNLVQRRRGVTKLNKKEQDNINIKYFQETGETILPPERIRYQQELKNRQLQEENRYVSINENFQQFFVKLAFIVKSYSNVQQYQQAFKLSAMAIVKLQLHLPRHQLSGLPRWFQALQGGIKVLNPLVSLGAIEAMIVCLMWEAKHPIYSSLKGIIMVEKVNKVGVDYQKIALEKLWSLLDYPHMHAKIIQLIVSFSKHFPNEFTQTVKKSFNTQNDPDKEASIQRFAHFWRLTGHKYKDLLHSHAEFNELNKVGLFRMLDFLDDPNPLVRHAARNWLLQSMSLLTRVLQPLLQELVVGCAQWYETPKGILLIQAVYDTSHIFNTFRRIRSILANGSFTFLKYVYQTQISQSLDQYRAKATQQSAKLITLEQSVAQFVEVKAAPKEPVLPKALSVVQRVKAPNQRMTYLDLLVILAVKYIQGHAIQSMGVQFYIGNAGVNASAVELIETLLGFLENPILCQKFVSYIMKPLFRVLSQVVLNKQYIMQIQLIHLVNNIFFDSSFRKKAQLTRVRGFFKQVFASPVFLKSLLSGLQTAFAYVRSQFIQFITACIPLIADFLEPAECTECIRLILFTYYKLIKEIGGSLTHTVTQEAEQEPQDMMGKMQASMSKIAAVGLRIRAQLKTVKFYDDLKQISKTNQILSILRGVEAVLNYFFDLNKLNLKQLNFEFTNPYTLFDTFKSIVTFGLASSQKQGKLVQKKNFLHNYETCERLLVDLQPVYETILRSWPLSQEFVRIASEEFSSVGMGSFNFDRFSRYNKIVRDLIDYVEKEKDSIWGKIYSIMQPMFCKFPKEIIDIYLKIWIRECSDMPSDTGRVRAEPARTELLMKIMETIIVNNFPMNIVVHAFLESTPLQQLTQHYAQKNNSNKGTVLNFDMDKKQSKLLYFVYVYFNYVYLNEKELTYDPLLQVWSLIMKVLKPFQVSKGPLSAIWILQIINLCSKKYSPKQLLKNQKFKSDLHALINQKLKYVAGIASHTQVVFFSEPSLKKKFEQEQEGEKYQVVLPLPPTFYDIHRKDKTERNNTDVLLTKECRAGEGRAIQTKYRIYCFKLLKKLGLQVLQKTYVPQKVHWIVRRAVEWLQIILPVIEDKSTPNLAMAECASQVLHDLLDKARMLFIKDLKPKVLHIFNKNDFFICSVSTLNYWAEIIDWIVSLDKKSETFFEYLSKVNLTSSLFTSQSQQNKKRIQSFSRICFILYSGPKDKYASRVKHLLQKIVQVVRRPQNAHAGLLVLVLFSLRVLILRLSEMNLSQLFIDIWPMIMALLMQTFTKQLVRVHISNEISKNPNYLFAALKLVQMISLTNLGQFSYHQWIFITDYFGADLTVPEVTTQMMQAYSKRPQLAKILFTSSANSTTPFIYQPFLLHYLPTSSISYSSSVPRLQNKIEQKDNAESQEKDQFDLKDQVNYKAPKRVIIIKDSFVRDEGELKFNCVLLMRYLISLNQVRTAVDWKQVEDVIVNDFINLDSFIHQIS